MIMEISQIWRLEWVYIFSIKICALFDFILFTLILIRLFIDGLLFIYLVICTNFILRNCLKSRTLHMCNNVPICFAPLNNNIDLTMMHLLLFWRTKYFCCKCNLKSTDLTKTNKKYLVISNKLHETKFCVVVSNSLNFLISKYCTAM